VLSELIRSEFYCSEKLDFLVPCGCSKCKAIVAVAPRLSCVAHPGWQLLAIDEVGTIHASISFTRKPILSFRASDAETSRGKQDAHVFFISSEARIEKSISIKD